MVAVSIAIVTACASVERDDASALKSLVDAERAFAAMSVAQGIRTAFAANFAPDGIAFEPAPVEAPRAFFSRPEPADRKPVVLDWQPAAAAVAASGDLGFTTGPFSLTDRASGRSRNGVYFSLWKRERGEPWRVALDAGISTPSPIAADALGPSPVLAHTQGDPATAKPEIVTLETRRVDMREYASWFASDGRLHLEGLAPLVGEAAIRAHLTSLGDTAVAFAPRGGAVSAAGDLAFTYGVLATTGALASGYYAHAWTRDAGGRWRLVVAVLVPSR